MHWLGQRLSPRWWWFTGWTLIGACYALAFIALSIGAVLLVPALIATYLITRREGSSAGLPGLVVGVGVVPLVVAFVNRDGPGQVCTTTATSSSCTQELSPWPWLIIGVVLVGAGIAWLVQRRRGAW